VPCPKGIFRAVTHKTTITLECSRNTIFRALSALFQTSFRFDAELGGVAFALSCAGCARADSARAVGRARSFSPNAPGVAGQALYAV